MEKQDFLLEQIKTIHNLTEVATILRNMNRDELLPTILELIYLEAQDMVDTYCIEEDK